MKIAIASQGKTAEDMVDLRFGRAKFFVVYDTETKSWSVADNKQNMQAVQGAGIQSATNLVNTDASVALCGNCGPKAFKTLSAAEVDVYEVKSGTCKEAVENFLAQKLTKFDTANVEEHWI